jgi:hypothetical protein
MITPPDSAPQAPPQMPASTWDIQAPYSGGAPSRIYTGGDANPAGLDDVAGTVAAAQAAAEARYTTHMHDTYGQGSQLGDAVTLPETNEHSKHQGGDDAGYPS